MSNPQSTPINSRIRTSTNTSQNESLNKIRSFTAKIAKYSKLISTSPSSQNVSQHTVSPKSSPQNISPKDVSDGTKSSPTIEKSSPIIEKSSPIIEKEPIVEEKKSIIETFIKRHEPKKPKTPKTFRQNLEEEPRNVYNISTIQDDWSMNEEETELKGIDLDDLKDSKISETKSSVQKNLMDKFTFPVSKKRRDIWK